MENKIFRKSSLERISSPEQLNEYVKVTNPSVWALLMGLFALLAAVAVWVFAGAIPETIRFEGVVYGREAEPRTVYCYLPMSDSKRLSEGMAAQVSPDYAPREEYGYIFGSIAGIGAKPISENDLILTFGNPRYVEGLIPPGNVVEVRISLKTTGDRLQWSNQKGQALTISAGTNCNVLIVTRERKPYELLFH